jgi:rare lipoprotein A
MRMRALLVSALMFGLVACSSTPNKPGTAAAGGRGSTATVAGRGGAAPACPEGSPYAAATEDPSTRGNYTAGGLYRPGVKDTTPEYVPNVACIPEPEVRAEPRSAVGNRSPYEVLGKQYRVLADPDGYVEQGTASYYGAKFHGRLTSNREVYDMYTFSAAHKTLPLPSFAEVVNLDNGQSVVVRVNDRGPFHEGRVIDLSYAAAVKLGITQRGTGRVEVRALTPGRTPRRSAASRAVAVPAAAAPAAVATVTPAAMLGSAVLTEALPESAPAAARPVLSAADAVLLQVGSFASRDNASRALQRLSAAGINGGRVQDVVADGRTLWRLRVAADSAGVPALAQRIAALGLGQPRVVNE